jgi:hypothetical protein
MQRILGIIWRIILVIFVFWLLGKMIEYFQWYFGF